MIDKRAQIAELDVSRETLERLRHYESLVRKWNPKINLVAKSTIDDIWDRHIIDSMQIFELSTGNHWLDLGSGGGFPGCVVAILAHELSQDTTVTLVESDQRKSVFLRTVLRETGVGGNIVSERIEAMSPQKADVVSARALTDLSTLLGYFQAHAAESAEGLFMKGLRWKEELALAQERWKFDYKAFSSRTQPDAVILKIAGVQRA